MPSATPNLHRILAAYLSGPISLPDSAKALAIDLADLLQALTSPAFLALVQTVQSITTQRDQIVQRAILLSTLSDICTNSTSTTARLRAACAILRCISADHRRPRTPEPTPIPPPPSAPKPSPAPPAPVAPRHTAVPANTTTAPPPTISFNPHTDHSKRPLPLLAAVGLPRPP